MLNPPYPCLPLLLLQTWLEAFEKKWFRGATCDEADEADQADQADQEIKRLSSVRVSLVSAYTRYMLRMDKVAEF